MRAILAAVVLSAIGLPVRAAEPAAACVTTGPVLVALAGPCCQAGGRCAQFLSTRAVLRPVRRQRT